MKYLSDSRRHWRETVSEVIKTGVYDRLQILTHPFWYASEDAGNIGNVLRKAIYNAELDYYDNLDDNLRDLNEIISRNEIKERVQNCKTI